MQTAQDQPQILQCKIQSASASRKRVGFINSVNIDDYVEDGYLEQAVCFVRSVFSQWNDIQESKKLIAILSLDEFGLKVKCHTHRVDEHWLSDELEDYEESILVVDSSESEIM